MLLKHFMGENYNSASTDGKIIVEALNHKDLKKELGKLRNRLGEREIVFPRDYHVKLLTDNTAEICVHVRPVDPVRRDISVFLI